VTVPVGLALAEAPVEVDVDAWDELDELLHPAAASAVHAMTNRATKGALFLAGIEVIPSNIAATRGTGQRNRQIILEGCTPFSPALRAV
jgi:hypothetical protein